MSITNESNRQAAGRCLAIDTSTSSMTLAILENGNLLGQLNTHAERNHSIGLLPNIQELLSTVGLRAKDLQAVIVGNGPGSYTGVRIGVTVAKTFAWSLGIDLIGVSSLEALALGGRRRWLDTITGSGSRVQWMIPLMDARRTQAFTGICEARGNWNSRELMVNADRSHMIANWRAIVPDGIHLMQQWTDQLVRMAEDEAYRTEITGISGLKAPEQLVFVGETEGFASILDPLAASQREGFIQVVPHLLEAYDIGLLGYPKLAGSDLEAVHTFVPNYTQLPEAEVKLLAKTQKGKG